MLTIGYVYIATAAVFLAVLMSHAHARVGVFAEQVSSDDETDSDDDKFVVVDLAKRAPVVRGTVDEGKVAAKDNSPRGRSNYQRIAAANSKDKTAKQGHQLWRSRGSWSSNWAGERRKRATSMYFQFPFDDFYMYDDLPAVRRSPQQPTGRSRHRMFG